MSSYSPTQYYTGTLPMPVPGKGQHPSSYYHHADSTYSVSPPEADVSVSSGSGVPSYSAHSGYSATASYAGSSHSGDYELYSDTHRSASGVDFNEYMHDHLTSSFDPLGLDKAVATQAQT